MDPFLTRLAELCRVERTRAKWVIVLSNIVGDKVGERHALEATSGPSLHR